MATKFSYEKTVEEIESIVDDIENNRMDIDQLADAVVRVSDLLKKCKQKLADTKAIVDKIDEDK
ncbi:MAG: exodeoxyribonuclease VII small subunit [Salinivirgaceae bacterium]|jgi:exodeoxyribonuclease VII small subunit|nr:exodeoxyribonuclease VII small subunit [Salinivirgaceae bacterium]